MKIHWVCACFLIWLLFLAAARAQRYSDPEQVFEPFQFEWTHRGTFNMSLCSRELINCWEFMRGDAQCTEPYIMESACTAMRMYCNDVYGPVDSRYGYNFEIQENYCAYYSTIGTTTYRQTAEYTRRSAKWDKKPEKSLRRTKTERKPHKVHDIVLPSRSSYELHRRFFSSLK